jgi:hypothetical protein
MPVTYVELESSRQHSVVQSGQWSGTKEFSCPRADVETNRELIRALAWSVNTVSLTPKKVVVSAWQDPSCPGNSRLTAIYSNMENPERYKVGKSYLSIRVTGRPRPRSVDLVAAPNARKILTAPAADGTYFRPVNRHSDLHIELVPEAIFRLTTAYTTAAIDFAVMVGKYGQVNDTVVQVASKTLAAIGTLKLIGVEIPQWFTWETDNAIIPIIYTFRYRPETWAGAGGATNVDPITTAAGYAAKYRKATILDYVLHPDDDPTTATRYYMKPDGSRSTANTPAEAKFNVVRVERDAPADAGDTGVRSVAAKGAFHSGGMFEILAWVP